jgi:hypothetical protein
LELYNISNSQLTGASFIGTIGLEWQYAGVAPIHAAGASDLVLRNVNTGEFEVYDIANNQLTGAASLGTVGLDWQLGGFAAVPPPASGANGAVTAQAGQTSEIASASSGAVTFAGDTGTLQLDDSASFAGTVAGLAGKGSSGFAGIDPATVQSPTFSGDSTGGSLNATDASHAGNVALLGNYMASLFVPGSDGHGGTSVVDPQGLGGVQPLITPPHT